MPAKPQIPPGLPAVHCRGELVPVETLKPHPRNPNRHPVPQLHRLAEVIRAAGWRVPLVSSNRSGLLVRGHGRLAAAKLAGWDVVPVKRQDYPGEAEELADLLADNRLAELAEMDGVALAAALAELGKAGPDAIKLSGFTLAEAQGLRLNVELPQKREVHGIRLPFGLLYAPRVIRRNGISFLALATYASEKAVVAAIKANGKQWPDDERRQVVEAFRATVAELGLAPEILTSPPAHHAGFHCASALVSELAPIVGAQVVEIWPPRIAERGHSPKRHLDRGKADMEIPAALPSVAGRRLVLLDDVATSGATMEKGLSALRAAGAVAVGIVMVAHRPDGGLFAQHG